MGRNDKTTNDRKVQLNPDLIVALEKAPEVNEAQVTYISALHTFLVPICYNCYKKKSDYVR